VHELRERLRQPEPGHRVFARGAGPASGPCRESRQLAGFGSQHEFLAEEVWAASAYGRNMIYDHGHHGNAILSRFPILHAHNQDITHLQFEKRGLLALPDQNCRKARRHIACAPTCRYSAIRGASRWTALADYLEQTGRTQFTPLIIAGDFNDWRNRAGEHPVNPSTRPARSVQRPRRFAPALQFPGGHADVPARPYLRARLRHPAHRSASRFSLGRRFPTMRRYRPTWRGMAAEFLPGNRLTLLNSGERLLSRACSPRSAIGKRWRSTSRATSLPTTKSAIEVASGPVPSGPSAAFRSMSRSMAFGARKISAADFPGPC
jgi:hypothetical protein